MNSNWIINSNNITDLACYAVAAAPQSFKLYYNEKGESCYRANIPLFRSQTIDNKHISDLNSVLKILKETTLEIRLKHSISGETCLHNVLKVSANNCSVIIEVDARHKDALISVYSDLLNSIKRYNPLYNCRTAIDNLKSFDMTPFVKNKDIIANDTIGNKVKQFAEKPLNKIALG